MYVLATAVVVFSACWPPLLTLLGVVNSCSAPVVYYACCQQVLAAPRSAEIRAMNPDFRRELKTASVHSLSEVGRQLLLLTGSKKGLCCSLPMAGAVLFL